MHRRALLIGLIALAPPLSAAAAERQRTGGEGFIQLHALTANVSRGGGGGRRGLITVDVGLDAPDAAVRARAEAVQPRLRADLYAQLQTYAAGLRPGEPPNPDLLAARFQATTDRVVGRRGARVLLGAILLN